MVNPEHVMGLAYLIKNLLSFTIIILVIVISITLPNSPDFNELQIIKTALMLFSH